MLGKGGGRTWTDLSCSYRLRSLIALYLQTLNVQFKCGFPISLPLQDGVFILPSFSKTAPSRATWPRLFDDETIPRPVSYHLVRRCKLSRNMWFPTMWHFDKCRLRQASNIQMLKILPLFFSPFLKLYFLQIFFHPFTIKVHSSVTWRNLLTIACGWAI